MNAPPIRFRCPHSPGGVCAECYKLIRDSARLDWLLKERVPMTREEIDRVMNQQNSAGGET